MRLALGPLRAVAGAVTLRRVALVSAVTLALVATTTVSTQRRSYAIVPALAAGAAVVATAVRTAVSTPQGRAALAGGAWGIAKWLGENYIAPIFVDLSLDKLANDDQPPAPSGPPLAIGAWKQLPPWSATMDGVFADPKPPDGYTVEGDSGAVFVPAIERHRNGGPSTQCTSSGHANNRCIEAAHRVYISGFTKSQSTTVTSNWRYDMVLNIDRHELTPGPPLDLDRHRTVGQVVWWCRDVATAKWSSVSSGTEWQPVGTATEGQASLAVSRNAQCPKTSQPYFVYFEKSSWALAGYTRNVAMVFAPEATVAPSGPPADPARNVTWNITCTEKDGTGGYVKSAASTLQESQLGSEQKNESTFGGYGGGGGWDDDWGGYGGGGDWNSDGFGGFGGGGKWGTSGVDSVGQEVGPGAGTWTTPSLSCDAGDVVECIGPLVTDTGVVYVPQYCYADLNTEPQACPGAGSCRVVWPEDDRCELVNSTTGVKATVPVEECRLLFFPNSGGDGDFPGCAANVDSTGRVVTVQGTSLCRLADRDDGGPEDTDPGPETLGPEVCATWDATPNPVTWVLVPLKCAAAWTLGVDQETRGDLIALKVDLSGKVPFGYVGQVVDLTGSLAVSETCWDGVEFSLSGQAVRLLDTCDGSRFAAWLSPLRPVMTTVLWLTILVPLGAYLFRTSLPGGNDG